MKLKTNYKIAFAGMGLVSLGALLKIKNYILFGDFLIILGLLVEVYLIYRFFSGTSKTKN